MQLQQFLDIQVFGVTLRTAARIVVFGGIALILIRKALRRSGGRRPPRGPG